MNKVKIVTHSGSFHTDDVFAVATLLLLPENSSYEIVRTRDEEVIKQGDFVVDVGGIYDPQTKRFDHHQAGGAGAHQSGIPYASFGLVWKEYGEKVSGHPDISKAIESKIVLYVDAIDNGITLDTPNFPGLRAYTISDYLYSYWNDDSTNTGAINETFERVVQMAKDLLTREIQRSRRITEEGKIVREIYEKSEDKRLIVLDKHYAWGKALTDVPEPLIVVYPDSPNGPWRAKCVRLDANLFDHRILFPKEWAGKMNSELATVSGVSDALFCHNNLFTISAKSREGAIALSKLALDSHTN